MKKFFTHTLCLIAIIFFSSCGKQDDVKVTPTGLVSVINASPGSGTYNIYLNNSKINGAALPLGGRVVYRQLAAGNYDLKFTTANSIESLLTKSVSVAENTVYTHFLIGNTGQLEVLTATDVMNPVAEKAAVRFVNLAPDAPALNLVIKDGESIISNQAYKGISDFVSVDPKTYVFQVKTQTGSEVLTTVSDATLVAGKFYTILVRGMVNPGDSQHPVAAELSAQQ